MDQVPRLGSAAPRGSTPWRWAALGDAASPTAPGSKTEGSRPPRPGGDRGRVVVMVGVSVFSCLWKW